MKILLLLICIFPGEWNSPCHIFPSANTIEHPNINKFLITVILDIVIL